MPWLVLILLAALASPAHATLYWASSFEHCQSPTADTSYWAASAGSPTITTSNVDTMPGGLNRCALRFDATSGTAAYVAPVTTASAGASPLNITADVRIGTAPTGIWRELAAIRNTSASGNYTKGCILAARFAATLLGVRYYTLGVFYGSTTATVCSGSTQNGKRCTTSADCPYAGNPEEPQCSASTLTGSPIIAEGSNILVTLQQTTGSGSTAGTVACALWQGAAGTSPAAYSRGSGSRTVGYCAGGANANAPCNVASECPASSCTVTDVVSPQATSPILIGASDTGAATATFQVDWAAIYDSTAMPNGYMEALELSATSTADADTNWTVQGSAHSCGSSGSQYQCLKDGTAPDGNDSALENNNAAKPTIALQFGNPATPSASPTPKAVVVEMIAQDTATSTNGITVDLESYDGTSQSTVYTPFAFDGFTGSGSTNDPYYLAPPSVWEQSWTTTKLNALEARINKTAGGGDNGRISSLVASVLYQTGNPAVPSVIPDRDQDGERTVCFVGDSTWDNIDFWNAMVANLTEPTNLYFYTRGGSKLGDSQAEWLSDLEGVTGTFLGLAVLRGTSGRTCDVVLLNHLTNVGFPSSSTDPKLCDSDVTTTCPAQGVLQGGYCEDDGGANQGAACYCNGQLANWTSNFASTATRYCVNHGDFKGTCESGVTCNCNSNADCARAGLPATGVCSGNICLPYSGGGGLGCAADEPVGAGFGSRNTYCMSGCLNATGCPNGVCVRHHSLTAVIDGFKNIQALTDARPTPNPAATPAGASGKPIVVYVIPPPGALFCWGETSRLAHGRYRDFLRQWAKANGYPFVDLWARFYSSCNGMMERACTVLNGCTPEEDTTLCYRDYVHHTYKGQVLIAAAMLTECLTNQGGTHDGVCTGNVCQAGLIGDACSADADCDTWSCNVGTQP